MISEQVKKFLESKKDSSFFGSLYQQAEKYGRLSDKQIACVMRAIQEEQGIETKKADSFSFKSSEEVEIKAFMATELRKKFELPFFFRRLELTEVLAETPRAIQVKAKFVTKVAAVCNMCGIHLDTEVSRACGIGPVCAKKIGIKRLRVEASQEIHKLIDEAGKQIGEVGPFWVPKSQIWKVAV